MTPSRVFLYVDGFNIYHSIMNIPPFRQYRWLDFRSLGQSVLSRRESLSQVYFFTAFYPGDPRKRARHTDYIKALELHGVVTVLGEFRRKTKHCKQCGKNSVGYEEKETDVNMALQIFKDAVEDRYDTAVILSNDSDLIPAIRVTKDSFPTKQIKILFPPGGASKLLKMKSDGYTKMKEKHLRANQFPDLVKVDGTTVQKPSSW